MKENKEETKLQSEKKTLQECKNEIARGLPFAYDSWFELVLHLKQADFGGLLKLSDQAAELYASQFKSQLPIEQKNELELIIAEKNIDIIHLRDRIKELESQPLPIEGVEREWISVKDRLPDDASRVLIFGCVKKYGVYAGAYFNFYSGGKWKSLGFEATDVTHWMPLPPPPKNG